MSQQEIKPISNREKLYNNLIETGRVSEREIGKKEDFINALSNPSGAKYVYDNLRSKFDPEEIGDETKFLGFVTADYTGSLPAGRPGGNLPKPTEKAALPAFINTNPFLPKDNAPAPLKEKANTVNEKQQFVDVDKQDKRPVKPTVAGVEDEMAALYDKHKDELAMYNSIKQKMNIPDVDSFTGYNARESRMMGLGGLLSKAKISKEEREFYENNKERLEDVEKQMKAMTIRRDVTNLAEQQESLDPNSPGIKKFWDGLTKSGTVKDFLTMGLSTMRDDVYMIELLEKASKDKNSINPEEQKLIDSYMKLQEMQSKDNGFWYGAGRSFREMVPFVINMIATRGIVGAPSLMKAAGAETFKAATKLGTKQAANYAARKAGSLMLGNMLRTPLTTTFYTDLAKRRVGNYQQDENGDIVKGDNTFLGDLYRSSIINTLEYMTEGFGDLVGRGMLTSFLARKRVLGPMSNYVAALEKITQNPVYKQVGKVLDKAQVHGIFTETFIEEAPNALLSSALTGSDDYKQLAKPEFYGTIAVNTALMNGIFKGTQLVSGGVANAVERGRLNSAAKTANTNLANKASELNDPDIIQAVEGVQSSINSNGYFNEDKSESAVIQAFQNLREVINKKGVNEDLEPVIDAASKAVLINAERAGAYEGLLSVAEAEMGGPVTMRKSPDIVAIGKNANEELMYITDVFKSELGKELMVVRNINSGESKTILSDEIEDIRTFDSKMWLDDWLKTRDALKPIETAMQSQEISDEAAQQQESTLSQPVSLSEVIPGAEFAIGEEIVTVIDATEEDIFVVDRDGNEHRVEIESLQRVPPVSQEAPAADVNAVNLPIQEEGQQLPIEPVQEPKSAATIEEAQQAEAGNSIAGGISIPVDKQGQIDYSQIAEPKMYAEALKSEFADESLSVLEDLIAEQREALKKAEKTTNAIERRRKIKIVNAELAKLNQAKTMLSPVQDVPSVQVAQQSAQEMSQPDLASKPTKRPGKKRLTPMQQDLMKFGDPTTIEEAIVMTILRDGIKFRMNDNKAEGIKGLAGHLGLKKGGKEYKKYFGLQNEKTGMSPEHLALYIKEMDDDGLFINLEDSDIFTDVLEVMRKAYSRRTLYDIIETSRRDQERRFDEEDYYESEEIKSNIASKEELTEEEYDEIIDDYFSEKYVPLSEQEVSTIESLIADSVKDEERWRIINESEDLPEDESGRNIAEGVQQRGADTDVSGSPTIGNNSQDSNEGGSNESTGGRAGADEAVLQGAPVAQSEQSVNPLRKEIESLNQSKKEAIAERDKIIANNAERVGLFGDTKQDPNDLFGGEGFDPSASQPLVDNQNKIIAELDRKIEVLTKNLEQGEKEAQGQLKIEEIAQEEARVNTEPTEKQKEAGNYQKGHIKLLGYDVTIEQPKGSTRSGVDKGGKEWSVTMNNTYGYILGTKGKDGEHIDVFVGENPLSEKVYVVDQVNQDGSFDEHKVMFGFDSIEDASKAYNANYEEGWRGLGNITEVSIDDFQKWTENKTRKIKPFAEYKAVAEVKEEGESKSAPLKIEDYGEKIEGARKDQIKKYFDKINLNGQILSTIFPKPDIKRLIESGLSTKDVSGIKVAHEFATQDKKRGADVIRFYAAYAKNILAESINLEFNNGGYVFTEYGKSQIELRTKAYQQVVKEIGDEYLQLDLTKVKISEMSEREVRSLVNKDISGKFKVQYYVSTSKYFATEEDAINAFVELVKGNTTKDTVEYKRKISVYQSRSTRDYYLGFQPKGRDFIKLSENYKTSKEAFEYLKNNEADLQIELERVLSEQKIGDKKPSVRLKFSNETTRDRVGKDWRGGRNVDSKEFAETFGFRGVEFGNWVNQKERQIFVNNSFDSLMDLAQLLNIPPKAISLSGQLGITFGSRGSGNAAAHYEPGRKIINLTKTQGLGSLAHEWYHAIDNYFAGFGMKITGMKSATESEFTPEIRDEVKKAFKNLYQSLNAGTYKTRSRNLDDSQSKNYYSLIPELSARAFENYILSRLNESGQINDFIVNYISVEDWNGDASKYPYPKAEESKVIYDAFNNLFETLDTKTDENDVTLLYEPLNTYKEYEKETPYRSESFTEVPRLQEGISFIADTELPTLPRQGEIWEERGYTQNSDGRLTDDTFAERQLIELKGFTLIGDDIRGKARIKSSADVAFLFKSLENASTENVFAVLIRPNGTYQVLWVSHGSTSASVVDYKLIVAAAVEAGATTVTFVHNHPSGQLKASEADTRAWTQLSRALRAHNIQSAPGIIINLDSGKYLEFDNNMSFSSPMPYDVEKTSRIKVYSFSKQVLYKPSSERTKITDSNDVAKFLSKSKRGITPKIGALILNRGNEVVRAILYDETISTDDLSKELLYEVGKHGESVILHSNARFKDGFVKQIQSSLSTINAQLIDVIQGEQGKDILEAYKSFTDEGLIEPEAKYDKKTDEMLFRDSGSDYQNEIDQIKQRSIADGTFMKAPNGKPTNLDEYQWLQVRTKAFKKWFGDWEKTPTSSSKIVDDNGEPLVVYHGTQNRDNFTRFDVSKIGSANDDGVWGSGFYFSNLKKHAEEYRRGGKGATGGGSIYPSFLSIKNPFQISDFKTTEEMADYLDIVESNFVEESAGIRISYSQINQFTSHVIDKGHDGVIVSRNNEIVAFSPNQIKSAIDNTGEFSTESDDIRFRDGLVNDSSWQDQVWDQNEDLRDTPNLDIYQRNQETSNIPEGYSSVHMAYEPGLRDIYANPKAYDEVDAMYKQQGYLSEGYIENTYDPEDFKLKDGYVAAVKASDTGKPVFVGGSASDNYSITFIGREVANIYDGKVVQVVRPLETWKKDGGSYTKISDNLFRQPYFYSPTERALNSIKQEKGTPEQWKAMLLKNGAKEAEMDWMGWEDFVDEKKSLTRANILEWIDLNRIEVQETELGSVKMLNLNSALEAFRDGIEVYGIDEKGNESLIETEEDLKRFDRWTSEEKLPQKLTRYEKYVLPGGENYKELLLTMPPTKMQEWQGSFSDKMYDKYGSGWRSEMTPEEESTYERVKFINTPFTEGNFQSSHFDEPNILAHIRFNERTTPSGEKVLFIEEIQSDWAQKGKKEGFKGDSIQEEYNSVVAELVKIRDEKEAYRKEVDPYNESSIPTLKAEYPRMKELDEKENQLIDRESELRKKKNGGVPDMPFKNTDQWVNLALRRMMIYAAENGFDRIAWTNGEMQADRYDLSKQVDEIEYVKEGDKYDLKVRDKNGNPVIKGLYPENELENIVGKEIANKIIKWEGEEYSDKTMSLKGVDLKVGGEGMKAFYDNIIPAQANKIGKKFGAKVETTEIPAIDKKVYDEDAGEINLTPEAEELYQKYMDSVEEDDGSYPVEQYVSDMENIGYEVVLSETGYPIDLKKTYKGEVYSVQSIPITPAIKEQATIGMPLYKPEKPIPQVEYKDMPAESVANIIKDFAKSLNTEIKIIYDTQEYPSNSRYRRAKGWFRPISGEVTIVLSKHKSIDDIKTTILHEVVGHKGLRSLLGDTFKKTMQRVFISLPKSVQADYFARYNNRVTAAEEYLSELTKYDIHPTLWQRIKGIIRDALRNIGIDVRMSDADMKYMLWRSKNRLQDQAKATSIEVMTDIVKSREEQSRLRSEGNALLREEREPFTLDSNDITLNKWEKTIEALQDRMVSGKKLIEEIKKRGGKVGAFSNFVTEENRSSSRAKAELDDFEDNYFKPILDVVAKWAKEGKSVDEISLYMMAKHAPERNRHIVIRDARESILYGFNKDLRKAEGKRRSATSEKDIKAIDESIKNIQTQIDFINSKENAGIIDEIMRNAYDVAFYHGNKAPLPGTLRSFDYMLALNIQKRAISILNGVAKSDIGNNRSGLTDQDASEIILEFEKSLKDKKDIISFWDNIKKATRFSLDKSLKYGLISAEVHAATSDMYEFYVPLRSWAEKEDIDYQDVFGDNYLGHEILNPVNKQAEGRTSLADNPLGFIASMAETAIVAGNKNEVRRNAWRLIKNNEDMTDLFLIKQAWEVNIAEIDEEPIWEITYEPPTEEQIESGMARRLSPNKTYEWHKSRGDIKKHQVPVLIDGSRVLVEFKGPIGARIAAAINGDDVVRWKRTEGIARLTRIMAALKTSKNPDFMLTNFLRDYFFGTMAYSARGGSSLTMTKNLGRAWIAIHKDFAKGKEDSYLKEMYDDFKMSGGETGYVHMLGEQDYKKKVEKLVKEANKAGSISPTVYAKKTIKVLNHGLDYLAHMSENAVRFATYLTEVERLTKEAGTKQPSEAMKKQAALAAKEVTTNFNRKGKWSSQVNSFYAFFNASVQGSANYIKLAKENPKGFVLYNMAMMSIRTALAAWCLSLFGDDDDEKGYLALSDYIKENNFVIPAGDSKFITIPLPHGARALTNIGPLALDVVMGKKSAAEAMDTYSKNIISELSPINLVGLDKSAFIPRKAEEVLLTMLPTVVRPFAETALNLDFMSRPIERKNFLATSDDYLPRFRNAYSSTNPILVGLSRELNKVFGGNENRSAAVRVDKEGMVSRSKVREIFDISPAYTEHIIEGYFGGLGRFVNDLYKTTRSAVQGEVPEKQNIPVVRRLYQEPYESVAWQKYFETRARVSDITMSMKAAKDTGDMEQYVSLNNYYNNSLITTFEIYNDIMKNISSNIKSLPKNDPMRKQAEKAMDKLVEQFNEEIKFIDKNHNRR